MANQEDGCTCNVLTSEDTKSFLVRQRAHIVEVHSSCKLYIANTVAPVTQNLVRMMNHHMAKRGKRKKKVFTSSLYQKGKIRCPVVIWTSQIKSQKTNHIGHPKLLMNSFFNLGFNPSNDFFF